MVVDDASANGAVGESPAGEPVARSHFFSRTLGDGWVEVEPGIYLERSELDEVRATAAEETLDDALSGALQPEDEDEHGERDEESGRLRRWLHR
jgi:hypothetical protein